MPSDAVPAIFGCRVLVVEDEYLIAADLADWLGDQGAEVVGPVPSVSDAMALLQGDAMPHVAMLDINLIDGLVFPVADALQAAGVPFVFVTGYDARLIPARFDSARRCIKPLDRALVLRLLADALRA